MRPITLMYLLTQRRFLPLFVCQFFGAFNDNIFRSALVVLITFHEVISGGYAPSLLVTLVACLFILPFFLFSSLAGQLADRFEKSRFIVVVKLCEGVVIICAVYGLYTNSLAVLLGALFLNAMQSAFFGPVKYSLLPVHLKDKELVTANAWIEAGTFVAILLGATLGASFVSIPSLGISVVAGVMILSSGIGLIAALYIPQANPVDENLKINLNIVQETSRIVNYAMQDRFVFLSILGISWFWAVGGIFLTHITTYGREIVGANESVVTLFLVAFTLGISLGSILCHYLMKGKIHARWVPWGAFGMTIFIIDLVLASKKIHFTGHDYIGLFLFLSQPNSWRIVADMLLIASCGGIFTVPLYAFVQHQSDQRRCSRIIAANNIISAFFMVISSLITMVLLIFDVTILTVFLVVGVVNIAVMVRISRLVPESILQLFAQAIFKIFFNINVTGLDNFRKAGDRVLIIANHISFLDSALLFAFIPEKLSFAIYTPYVNKWWIRIIASGITLYPINPLNPMATRSLIEHLKQNRKCVIFPEGRMSVTGSLMKVYDGPGMVADKAKATILPIRIDGAEHTYFSRLGGVVPRRLFPKLSLTILPPRTLGASKELAGKTRRKVLSSQVYDLMARMLFESSPYRRTLGQALIDSSRRFGRYRSIIEDASRQKLSYQQVLLKSFVLGRALKNKTVLKEYVGLMLPTSNAAVLSFFGLVLQGRVPAILNFSLGPVAVLHMVQLARLRLVVTSRKFVEAAALEPVIEILTDHVKILYLEDLRAEIGIAQKLRGALLSFFPRIATRSVHKRIKYQDPAVVLFTSGSEGKPKGVVLSHSNINANRYQMSSIVNFNQQDIVLNVLPVFHSFGLTSGTLLPILAGIPVFLYPSPLHFRKIPAIAYDINTTIFFATDTFLRHYAKAAHPYDFYATRYIFAGAEKLKDETRHVWQEKFGLTIFEGYGTTETTPVLSVNTPMHNEFDTVGRFLPGIEHKVTKVSGIKEGGRLIVKGPNVMLGYLNSETGKIDPCSYRGKSGWYDTGDIVSVNEFGFITIKGRAKRFAKIGGEMISLVAVEEGVDLITREQGLTNQHVAVSIPDARRGELLILLTTSSITKTDLRKGFHRQGLTELMLPRTIIQVDEIPMLPTGKTDFRAAQQLVEDQLKVTKAA